MRRTFILTLAALAATLFLAANIGASPSAVATDQLGADALAEVMAYVEGRGPADPLVRYGSVEVKTSNWAGVEVDGTRYFYALRGHQSFDPLSRGAVRPAEVSVVATVDDGGIVVVVYTLGKRGAAL